MIFHAGAYGRPAARRPAGHSISNSAVSPAEGGKKSLRIILIDFAPPEAVQNVYNTDIKIGHYTDYKVYPTCGLTIFGSTFGNYAQDIKVSIHYARPEDEATA